MTDVIDSIRGLRNQTLTFEQVISGLTCEIGRVERLTDLTPDQMERLWKAVARLGNAAAAKAND
jgi:hypothetical protein